MIRHALYVLLAAILAAAFLHYRAQAMENIIRPYFSVRSVGMGTVRTTTGFYDENFFGNPARVVENPRTKFQLFDPTFETSPKTITTVSDLLGGGGDTLNKIGDTAGTNLHGRVQFTFPGFYSNWGKTYYAIALISSTQFDVNLRRSYQVDPTSITDIGPAFTLGRRFLGRDRLALGLTTHLTYRLATKDNFSFLNLIRGDSLSPLKSGGDGTHLDFDLGSTYDLPGKWGTFTWHPGFSVNNILDGRYSNIHSLKFLDNVNRPRQQPRSFNVGIAGRRPDLFFLRDTTLALEFTDIGNNKNGSFFRLIHMGAETHISRFAFRGGFNQGYPTLGFGMNLRFFELDAAYYGEEMTLNTGGYVDHRIALRLAFQI